MVRNARMFSGGVVASEGLLVFDEVPMKGNFKLDNFFLIVFMAPTKGEVVRKWAPVSVMEWVTWRVIS